MTKFAEAARRVAAGGDALREASVLVGEMSVDEKLGCLDGDVAFWPGIVALGNGSYHQAPFPAAKVERLGIPGLDFADGPRGCVVGPCTVFPVSMARGASFDPELERRIGLAIGKELHAQGATYTGAVCMNLLRHPAWGRAQETYGEDPHHVGEMAAALTEGLQVHVMACMKHFALNSMENSRFKVDVSADERALHEVYLPHFRRVVDAGVASVMSAYNAVNGQWCGDSDELLTRILRDEWGFEGFVITDFTFGLRDAVASVRAGCNIEMPFRQQRAIALPDAVEDGRLSMETVDARVTETLATFLRFHHVYDGKREREVIACTEHRALAREAAAASAVLLRNESVLPLARASLTRVAVLGRLAAQPNLGDGGSSNVLQSEVATPLIGLRAALPDAQVDYAEDDAAIAKGADVAVVIVGYTKIDEGEYVDPEGMKSLSSLFPPSDHPATGFPETPAIPLNRPGGKNPEPESPAEAVFATGGDRKSLRLHASDEALIARVVSANPRTVVAIVAGSAVVMPWLDDVPAALYLWYAGMEGGHALAEVLLGEREPGGRLPFAIPENEDDLVEFDRDATQATYGLLHGQWWLDAREISAKRPFGFGLGYTSFSIRDPELERPTESEEAQVAVRVLVTNDGQRAGSTVIQIYASLPDSRFPRPRKRLVGFQRLTLAAGVSRSVTIGIDRSQLRIRSEGRWLEESTAVDLYVGQSASDARLRLRLS